MKQQINYIDHHRQAYFKMSEDNRLSPFHISLYNALFMIWNECGFDTELSVNRNDMMKLSKIGNANTYTKILRELDSFGYIVYKPSFNPVIGSKVTIITFGKGSDKGTVKGGSKGGDKGGDTLYKLLNNETNKQLNIEERKLNFSSTLEPYLPIYGKDLLNDFYKYWTEPNKSNTKFKQELEKTWSLERRLETWSRNDKNFNNGKNGTDRQQFGALTAELRRNDPTL